MITHRSRKYSFDICVFCGKLDDLCEFSGERNESIFLCESCMRELHSILMREIYGECPWVSTYCM
jgi:hypothetical protein